MICPHLISVTSISLRKAEAIVHPKGSHAPQHNFARLGGYKGEMTEVLRQIEKTPGVPFDLCE